MKPIPRALRGLALLALAFALATAVLCLGCRTTGSSRTLDAAAPQAVSAHAPKTLEEERRRREDEKKELVKDYSDNLDRIQEINARLIEINITLGQQAAPQ